MATLQHQMSGHTITLRSHHTFGRHQASVDTYVENADVSQIHAAIRWEGESWRILDLSRNGTWVDQQRLPYGESVHLCEANTIRFGASEQSTWRVVNLQAPKTILLPLQDGAQAIELDTFHGLPDDCNPEISLYISENGQWLCERADGVIPLNDGDVIQQGDMLWKFHCAGVIAVTLDATRQPWLSMHDITCQFDVSSDEEHVFLKLIQDRACLDLGERVHHYLLLTLARHRLQDEQRGVNLREQGWIELDDLAQMLDLDPSHVNILIFRARQQIAKLLPDFAYLPQIVERRVGSVRFGNSSFTITRASEVEGASRRMQDAD